MLNKEDEYRLASTLDVVNHEIKEGKEYATEWKLKAILWLVTKLKEANENRKHGHAEGYTDRIEYLTGARGTIQLSICTLCGHMTVLCEHQKNTWHDGKLICDLCGVDGT